MVVTQQIWSMQWTGSEHFGSGFTIRSIDAKQSKNWTVAGAWVCAVLIPSIWVMTANGSGRQNHVFEKVWVVFLQLTKLYIFPCCGHLSDFPLSFVTALGSGRGFSVSESDFRFPPRFAVIFWFSPDSWFVTPFNKCHVRQKGLSKSPEGEREKHDSSQN